jgi:[ribosomal protein S5]-alanine N-acetyltransferase
MPSIVSRMQSAALETARLTLRRYQADDLDAMAAMYGDAEVTAYTKLGQLDRERVGAVLDDYIAVWRTEPFGMRAMLRKPEQTFVGECGLFRLADGGVALRYAVPRAFWGMGYAREAVVATVDDAFQRTDLPALLSIVQRRNVASMQVMQRLGWGVGRETKDGVIEHCIFRLTREEWRSSLSRLRERDRG